MSNFFQLRNMYLYMNRKLCVKKLEYRTNDTAAE